MTTRFHELDQSGWWSSFSASSATIAMNPKASTKLRNSISRCSAPSAMPQPGTSARRDSASSWVSLAMAPIVHRLGRRLLVRPWRTVAIELLAGRGRRRAHVHRRRHQRRLHPRRGADRRRRQRPLAVVPPGDHRRGRRRRRAWPTSTACRSPPAASGTGLSGALHPASRRHPRVVRAHGRRSSRSTPTTTSPSCSPASRSTSSTTRWRRTGSSTRCSPARTAPASAATSPPTPAACGP